VPPGQERKSAADKAADRKKAIDDKAREEKDRR
jgi:hypothetical protein